MLTFTSVLKKICWPQETNLKLPYFVCFFIFVCYLSDCSLLACVILISLGFLESSQGEGAKNCLSFDTR